ncbi:MAG TPA: glycosyltransferase family 39 protein [bacterium]|nr:glycosyltransferase family 39 protein [bacterium]
MKHWCIAALILVSAAGIRLTGLDRQALWGDEACMVFLCQESSTDIVDALASSDRPDVDVAPPLYFLLLHGWMRLLGTSIWAFRGFSALFGVLAVAAVMGLGRRLFNTATGLFAGALAAIHPFQVWYSQEGRMYAMAAFLAAAAMWSAVAAMNSPRRWYMWLGFGISGVALLYTQYYGALLLTALVLGMLLQICGESDRRRERILGLAGTLLVWTAAFAPWLPVLVTDYRHAGAPGGFPLMFDWLQTPIFLYIKALLFGNQNYIMDHLWLYPIPMLAGTLLLLSALRSIRNPHVKIMVWAGAFPFAVVYGLSLLGLRVYKSHPFIIFHPALIVLIAWGYMKMRRHWRYGTMAIFVAAQLFILTTLVLGGDYVKPRSDDAAAWIETRSGPDARVAVIPAFIPNPMPIVGDLLAFRYHAGPRFDTVYLTGDTADDLVRAVTAFASENPGGSKTISRPNRMHVVCQLNHQVQPYLDAVFEILDQRWRREDEIVLDSRIRGFGMMIVVYEIRSL